MIAGNGPAPLGLYIQPVISGPASLVPAATLGKRTGCADTLPANSTRKAIARSRIMLHSNPNKRKRPT
jgi:hypothetical protein